MATEADIPEAISVTKEGEGRYLTTGQFDITVNQCSPVQLNKSEGELDEHPETVKCLAEGKNEQVKCSMQVESKNNSFRISEGGTFLAPLSDPRVDKQETCISEISQGDESNQAEMEMPDSGNQLQRGKEFEVVEEMGREEKEVIEETGKKAEQHIESHVIVNEIGTISEMPKTEDANLTMEAAEASKGKGNLDQPVQVVSNQQDSINENPQCVEKEAKSLHEDVKGRALADGNADPSSEQVSILLDETSLQEDEASVCILDSVNNSFKNGGGDSLEKEIQENITDTAFPMQTEETRLQEVGSPDSSPDIFKVYPEIRSEDNTKESSKEVRNQNENLEETPEAIGTTSGTDKDDENSERQFDSPCVKHEDNTQTQGEALDTGEASAGKEEDSQGFVSVDIISYVEPIQAIEHSKMKSTDYEVETEASVVEQIEPITCELARPLNLNSDENEAATTREDSKSVTIAEEETQVINLEQSFQEEGKEEKGITGYDITEDEIPEEKILKESEIDGVGETTTWEPNKNVERSEAILNISTLECEGEQGEGKNPAPTQASKEDNKAEGKFTVKVAEDDDDCTDAVTVTETSEKVTSNDEEDSPPALQKYEPQEELQHFLDVMPEETKTESSREIAEVITCRKEERTIQNTQESSDKENKELTKSTNNTQEKDTAIEEVFETTSTEQATGKHALQEIHTVTVADPPQDFIDKETNEEKSPEYEACIEAADLSESTEEKNLEGQATRELSSSLIVEETTNGIPKEEEAYVVILKEEKEAHEKCNEPTEVTRMTHETQSETAEDRTEPDKDFHAPISEEETHTKESNKTFVQNISFLSEASETEIERNIQEKDNPTISNSDSVSGVVSHVTGLKEAETENNDNAPIDKGLTTILTDETTLEFEDVDAQKEKCFNAKENLEKQIPTTVDEHDTSSKEAEAEDKEQVKNTDIVPEEKGLASILTDEPSLDVEDIYLQAEENFESTENLEEQILTAADGGEISLKEAEVENKEQIINTDIAPKDIDDQAKKFFESKVNLEEQNPIVADQGEPFLQEEEAENKEHIKNTDIVPEDIDVQAEVNFESRQNLEKQIPTTANEQETSLKEAEAEDKEPVKITDIVPEEKGLATVLTDEPSLDVEDIYLQAEENFESTENLEEHIPTAADEGETFLKEAEVENKEQIVNTDIPSEDIDVQAEENFKSKVNLEEQIPTAADEGESFLKDEEAENKEQVNNTDIVPEDIYVQAEENFESKGNLEKQIPTPADEHETSLKEAEAEEKKLVKNTDIVHEEKGLATILTDEPSLGVEDIDVQPEEILGSKENLEEQIPTAADEGETLLKEAEVENKEQIINTGIAPEEKGVATILRDEKTLDIEAIVVQSEETINSKENLEKQIPTATEEHETGLKEAKAENNEQVKNDFAPEEKVLATILTDETALAIEGINVQAEADFNTKESLDEQILTEADEGEEKLRNGNIILDDTPAKENKNALVGDKTADQILQLQSLEEAEPKLGVENESYKLEDHPEKSNMMVEEVLDEPEMTRREFSKEDIIEGNVAVFTQESSEEDTVNNSQENERETKSLKEEGISIGSIKEGNDRELSQEYIPEDGSEGFKDDKGDAVKSEGEIFNESQAAGVGESTSCETNKIAERSEELVNTSPEGQQGEGNNPASAKASNEDDRNEETFSVKVAKEDNDDSGAVTVTETSANVGEEGLPRALQKYEPGEGQELLHVMPEETKTVSSSENAEVVTCTNEERIIENIQESPDKEKKEDETKPMNGTKENDTGEEEVSEITSTEQETGEHASWEIHTVEDHTQDFNDKETTETNSTEYQVCTEAADLRINTVENYTEEQASQKLSSSLLGEDTSTESSKQEENYVSNLKEKKNVAPVECKEPIEVTNMTQETNLETLEDTPEPKEDLNAPISEEDTHTEESNKTLLVQSSSFQSQVSEKDGSTVGNSDSGVLRHKADLEETEAENTEQVKNIDIALEEKGQAIATTDRTISDISGIDLQLEESFNSKEFSENQIPTVAVEKTGHENLNLDDTPVKVYNTELVGDKTVEQSFQVQSHEDAEPKLRVEEECHESEDHPENNNTMFEEPQLLEQIFDEPKSIFGDFNEGKTTEGNATVFKNSQDNDKETEKFKEEGSIMENMRECNTNDLSPEFIPEDGSKKFKDDEQDAGTSKREILRESHTAGVGESTTCETNKIAERSEEIVNTSAVKYEEGQQGEGDSPNSEIASKEEDRQEKIFSVKVSEDGDDKNGEVKVTETGAKVASNGEEDSAESLENYELGEEEVQVNTSDLAYESEVCNSEDKASFSEKTAEETSLQNEGHKEISELAWKKLDEEQIREGSEIVPKSDSQSTDVVSKDEIISYQTLHESKEQLQIPSSTLLPKEKELSKIQENIIEENTQEKEVPADENTGDLFAARSAEETHLQKEKLKDSELALEKLDEDETEEITETFETISKSDSQSIDAVPKDKIITNQTLLEGITDIPIQTPSYTVLPKEDELKTYQQEHETTSQVINTEEKHAKEIEVPADENGGDLFAARSVEDTIFQKEEPRELKVSEAPEELDAGETEVEIKTFKTVSKSDSQGADVVSKDEIIAYQTLQEGISKWQLQIPSSALLPEEKELKASQHEHETTTQDKNIEEVRTQEKEVPAVENRGDLFAARSAEEMHLKKEELKDSELALEKLDDNETEQIKETFETISKSDSQSIHAVPKEEILANQILPEGITDTPIQTLSYTVLPKENALKTYQHEHKTTSQDINTEVEHAKEMEVPDDENEGDLSAARSVEDTVLQKEEPRELKFDLAPKALDAGETEEEIKETFETVSKSDPQSTDVVSKDKTIAYQTLQEGISKWQLQIPSSTFLPEEKELKASQHEHETTTQDKNIEEERTQEKEVPAVENTRDLLSARSAKEAHFQKEESRELKDSELALEQPDAGETEDIKETFETISQCGSQSTDAVSKDEIIADQTLPEGITEMQIQTPSYSVLPKEKELNTYPLEHETTIQDKNIDKEQAKETEVPADENGGDLLAASSVEDAVLQKEEPTEPKVSELAEELDDGESGQEIKETIETVSISDSQSTDVVSKDEIIAHQTLHEENWCETKIKANETRKNEVSNEEGSTKETTEVAKQLNEEKESLGSKELQTEENLRETRVEANETINKEVSNEEIKEDKELLKDPEVDSITEESHQENIAKAQEYHGEKTKERSTIRTNENQNEFLEVDEKGITSGKVERQLTSEDISIKDHEPLFIEDKTAQSSFPQEERSVDEAAIGFGLKNQGDEVNSESSITTNLMEKTQKSSTEVSQEDILGFEEGNLTGQDIKQQEETSHATYQPEIPTEEYSNESTATNIPTGNKDVLSNLQDTIVEPSQVVELDNTKPRNDTWDATEIKKEECGKEKIIESGTISLPKLIHESTKETTQVVPHLTEEKEPAAGEELQTKEEEEEEEDGHEHVEEVKTDEERGENEHKDPDPGYDSPIFVEASKDTDAKVSPKKSHGILSGMGSKVKHSISKVKKAITGKSSHSKTQSEK